MGRIKHKDLCKSVLFTYQIFFCHDTCLPEVVHVTSASCHVAEPSVTCFSLVVKVLICSLYDSSLWLAWRARFKHFVPDNLVNITQLIHINWLIIIFTQGMIFILITFSSETSRDLRLFPTTLNSSSSSTILDSLVSALSSALSRSASTMANFLAT